jgi:DNA-binding response OmpR family regulator
MIERVSFALITLKYLWQVAMRRVLLLEDDRLFAETIKDYLEEEGFLVDIVFDPYSAYDLTFKMAYNIYLFDINLPFEDGLKTLKSLRDSGDNTPTLFITSRDDRESLREGFGVGGDDYLKKPFDLEELKLRIEAILKRVEGIGEVKFRDFILNRDLKELYLRDKKVKISLKEFKLIELLLLNRNRIVTYQEIYSRLWHNQEPSYASLRVYINSLKKYFPNIETVRGEGYIFRE